MLDQFHNLDIANAADNVKHGADRRRDNAYAQVEDEEQTKVVGVNAGLLYHGEEHTGAKIRMFGCKVHDHADEEEEDIDAQKQQQDG